MKNIPNRLENRDWGRWGSISVTILFNIGCSSETWIQVRKSLCRRLWATFLPFPNQKIIFTSCSYTFCFYLEDAFLLFFILRYPGISSLDFSVSALAPVAPFTFPSQNVSLPVMILFSHPLKFWICNSEFLILWFDNQCHTTWKTSELNEKKSICYCFNLQNTIKATMNILL